MKIIREKKWDREILKTKIRQFLTERGSAHEMDVCVKFKIRLQLACEVLDELVAEGKIEPVKRKKR